MHDFRSQGGYIDTNPSYPEIRDQIYALILFPPDFPHNTKAPRAYVKYTWEDPERDISYMDEPPLPGFFETFTACLKWVGYHSKLGSRSLTSSTTSSQPSRKPANSSARNQ
jgi:hypothetical protein